MCLRNVARACALLGGIGAAAVACAQDAGHSWVLTAGGEIDDESGYRLDAGAAWIPVEPTAVSALVGRSDSSTDFGDFTSTVASLSLDHSFDPIGVTLEARWRDDAEFLRANTWAGSLYFKRGAWRVALKGETRSTDFDPQTFENVVITRQGVPILASATSTCSLDNTGFGAVASYVGSLWSARLSATEYDYSDADCEFTNFSPPSAGRFLRLRPNLLPLIAPRLFEFQRLQRSSVTRESTFLDSTLSAGLGLRDGPRTWELDYFHDREQFQELQSDTLIAALTFPVGARSDLEVRLGVTESDVVGTVGFAGFTVFAYLGGP